MKNLLKYIILILFVNSSEAKLKIGLCVTATNKYIKFVDPLLQSARRYFFKNHEVNFFIFTDVNFEHQKDTKIIYLKHKPWPYSTMQRFEAYFDSQELLKDMDYVFACDADMLFMNEVSKEILSDRVAL